MKRLIELLIKLLAIFTPKRLHRFLSYETISYLFFGGLATLVSIGTFALFFYAVGLNGAIAGAISNVLAIIFAFVTNKLWVFESPSWGRGILVPEMIKFGISRGFTLILDVLALMLLVDRFGFNAMLMRLVTMIVIQVIGNYAFSKWLVFTKKGEQNDT